MNEDKVMFRRVVHPGLILKDELDASDVTLTEFARQIDVPPNRVSQIIAGKRSITGDTALRFGHWFRVDPRFWLNLQSQHDLAVADRRVGKAIRHLPTKERLPARREPAEVE
jgi:addiction module HigA family antidote